MAKKTLYPKDLKNWTHLELCAIGKKHKGYNLSCGGGLVGSVRGTTDIYILFRYGFKWQGKKEWFFCGSFPSLNYKAIKANRDAAAKLVSQGINPVIHKQAEAIKANEANAKVIAENKAKQDANKTVTDLFNTWVLNGIAHKDGNKEVKRSFEKDVLPMVGHIPVKDLKADDIRGLLRKMVKDRGINRSAVKLLENIQQMFRWANDEQPYRRLLIEGDPSKRIKIETIVDADYDLNNERDRILSPAELQELQAIFKKMEADYMALPDKRTGKRPVTKQTQLALWIALSTCCRIGEILQAEWSHIDLAKGNWVIPKENYKHHRNDTRGDYLVCLSTYAINQFKALQTITGGSRWCFPSKDGLEHVCLKSISKQVGDRQFKYKNRKQLKNRTNDNSLVLTSGVDEEWTPHDLRRTGSTIMQTLGVPNDIRNLCLNHVVGSKIDRTYGLYEYEKEKREAWEKLGDKLVEISGLKGYIVI